MLSNARLWPEARKEAGTGPSLTHSEREREYRPVHTLILEPPEMHANKSCYRCHSHYGALLYILANEYRSTLLFIQSQKKVLFLLEMCTGVFACTCMLACSCRLRCEDHKTALGIRSYLVPHLREGWAMSAWDPLIYSFHLGIGTVGLGTYPSVSGFPWAPDIWTQALLFAWPVLCSLNGLLSLQGRKLFMRSSVSIPISIPLCPVGTFMEVTGPGKQSIMAPKCTGSKSNRSRERSHSAVHRDSVSYGCWNCR